MLFDPNDWKLSVTDIDLYANTCKLRIFMKGDHSITSIEIG